MRPVSRPVPSLGLGCAAFLLLSVQTVPQSSIICLITGVKAQRQSCEAAGPSLSFRKSVLDAGAVISSGLDEAVCCSSGAPLL